MAFEHLQKLQQFEKKGIQLLHILQQLQILKAIFPFQSFGLPAVSIF